MPLIEETVRATALHAEGGKHDFGHAPMVSVAQLFDWDMGRAGNAVALTSKRRDGCEVLGAFVLQFADDDLARTVFLASCAVAQLDHFL